MQTGVFRLADSIEPGDGVGRAEPRARQLGQMGSRTADDRRGERALGEGPDGRAPREGRGGACDKHCPFSGAQEVVTRRVGMEREKLDGRAGKAR